MEEEVEVAGLHMISCLVDKSINQSINQSIRNAAILIVFVLTSSVNNTVTLKRE